jgi:DNA-binding protein H-NS
MPKHSIASQLAAIQKQRDLLTKKEAALKAESHGKVLIHIVKMARDAGLTLAEITHAFESQKTKPISTIKTSYKKSSSAKSHTMKGIKLPAKYRNPLNPTQTWTGRGVDPAWVAKLRETGLLENALIQVVTDAASSSESLN